MDCYHRFIVRRFTFHWLGCCVPTSVTTVYQVYQTPKTFSLLKVKKSLVASCRPSQYTKTNIWFCHIVQPKHYVDIQSALEIVTYYFISKYSQAGHHQYIPVIHPEKLSESHAPYSPKAF